MYRLPELYSFSIKFGVTFWEPRALMFTLDETTLHYAFSAAVLAVTACAFSALREHRKLSHIPTLGHSWPILSYISAYRFRTHARQLLEEGYRKYPSKVWKLATPDRWLLVGNGAWIIQELGKANDSELSAQVFFQDFLHLDYTLGKEVVNNPYHISVIRMPMTRNVTHQIHDLVVEVGKMCDEMIPRLPDWTDVPLFETVSTMASHVSTILFVGHPVARSQEFRDLCYSANEQLARGRILRYFPRCLRHAATPWVTKGPQDIERLEKLLRPVVEERNAMMTKPDDMLSWFMEEAIKTGEEPNPRNMAVRIYFTSFSSGGSGLTLGGALYSLARYPPDLYLDPIRKEIEEVVESEGWSKESMAKMVKLDAFLRETLRVYDPQLTHIGRMALKDVYLSDGTFLPRGSVIQANAWALHHDEAICEHPYEFDGFRYLSLGEECSGTTQDALSKPTLDWTPFGYGKRACPGRFFAVALLKTFLAHILTSYDIRLSSGQQLVVGRDMTFASPDQNLMLAFRERERLVEIYHKS